MTDITSLIPDTVGILPGTANDQARAAAISAAILDAVDHIGGCLCHDWLAFYPADGKALAGYTVDDREETSLYIVVSGDEIDVYTYTWTGRGPLITTLQISANDTKGNTMEKMLMNPHTGSVAPESEWREDFANMTPEEWGADTFEAAELIEVVQDNGNWIEVR